ncbi:hypothetical protein EV356DRAFT_451520 [Viridothelium virens]|uniref:Cora-domain-containing protein n=1 Tax=Viridothelium virens TaxID=1048519 RepID=A0A6A6H0U3_VIRVR|nr:hypothetical protein EV356DRAFT_451520 [Viridothelium virens]
MSFERPDDYRNDPYWKKRRLTPAQLLVHDIELEHRGDGKGEILKTQELLSSTIVPGELERDELRDLLEVTELSAHPIEQQKWSTLVDEYGWLQSLRDRSRQGSAFVEPKLRQCRWIHISSKQTEYLEGCLFGLSDWRLEPKNVSSSLRQLEQCISKQERFSKHGRYFTPFFQNLSDRSSKTADPPLLLSVPFLDWSVQGKSPPLRFQVDKTEGYRSSRTSSHLLRSVLQHFYRLENTAEREKEQVFYKYRPWTTDRELDLKIRRWYGEYPTGLNVDELWILVIDDRHIVSFASNQSWKSRWPPLQMVYRVADVSFRSIRNAYFVSQRPNDYTALTHAVACLNGATGLLHRSFWPDVILCLTDRYAGYLNHLQYRLHRAPSTKLLMDLLQIQEELNIVIKLTKEQLELMCELQKAWKKHSQRKSKKRRSTVNSVASSSSALSASDGTMSTSTPPGVSKTPFGHATLRQLSLNAQLDPLAQLIENLHRELMDLQDLHENSNNLVTRTVQLVNIRLEDHGKAILVFTIVTIVFLPLSFVSSFFGMNFADIRNMSQDQGLFWIVGASVTAGVVGFSMLLAFYGTDISEKFFVWKEQHRDAWHAWPAWSRRGRTQAVARNGARELSFEILQASKTQAWHDGP